MLQMSERKISRVMVETAIGNPDAVVTGKTNRRIYQKIQGDKLIRVVAEGDRLITVYVTNRIGKYTKGGGK